MSTQFEEENPQKYKPNLGLSEPKLGNYEIKEELGAGGMGVVYKAWDSALKRPVAIKVISKGRQTGKSRKRFLREIEITSKLDHPNIVKIYNTGEAEDTPYLVMEYVDGLPLLDYERQHGLSLMEKAVVMEKIARALAYAHKNKIVHRDIKPSNIMVRSDGEPVLMDFGLAKVTQVQGRSLTQSDELIGTPQYMAPEQARGKNQEIDTQSDIYALGGVFYHLITGLLPVKGDTLMEVLRFVIEEQPPLPRSINAEIPEIMEKICLKAMEKKKSRRYRSAVDFANDLQRFFKGEKTIAGKYYKTRALFHILAWSILILTIVFTAFSLWCWHWYVQRQKMEMPNRWIAEAKRLSGERPDMAIAQLSDLIVRFPSLEKAYLERAQIYYRLKEIDAALEDISSAIEITPCANYYLVKGEWAREAGYYQEAYNSLQKGFQKEPHNVKILNNIARVAECMEKYEEAYRFYSSQNQIQYDLQTEVYLGRSAFHQQKYAVAMEHIEKAISNPSLPKDLLGEAMYYRGLFWEHEKNIEKALKDLHDALDSGVMEKADIQYRLGTIYLSQNQFDQAVSFLKPASESFPEDISIQEAFGESLMRKEQYALAIPVFSRCIALQPWNCQYYYRRGTCYGKMRRYPEAESDFMKCLRIRPEDFTFHVAVIENVFYEGIVWNYNKIRMFLRAAGYTPMPGFQWDFLFTVQKKHLENAFWQSFQSEQRVKTFLWDKKKYDTLLKSILESKSQTVHAIAADGMASMYKSPQLHENLFADLAKINDPLIKTRLKEVTERIASKYLPYFRWCLLRSHELQDDEALKEMYHHRWSLQCLAHILYDNTENTIVRFWAARTLSQMKRPDADQVLETASQSSDTIVKLYSHCANLENLPTQNCEIFERVPEIEDTYARAVGVFFMPAEKYGRLLKEFLHDRTLEIRLLASQRLRMSEEEEAENHLLQGHEHSSPIIRAFCVAVYWGFSKDSKLLYLDTKTTKVPVKCSETVKKDEKHISLLIKSSEDPDSTVRRMSLLKLIQFDDPKYTGIIARYCEDKETFLRIRVLTYLFHKGIKEQALAVILNPQESFTVRMVVIMVVSEMCKKTTDYTFLAKISQTLRNDPDPLIRTCTMYSVGIMTKGAITEQFLLQGSYKKDEATKLGSLIGMSYNGNTKFLPRIEKMLEDDSDNVRNAAAIAFVYLTGLNRLDLESSYKRFALSPMHKGAAWGFAWIFYQALPGIRYEETEWNWDNLYSRFIETILNKAKSVPWDTQNPTTCLKGYIDLLSRSLQLDSGNANVWFERGILYYVAGERKLQNQEECYQKSVHDMEKAVAILPGKFIFQRWLAHLYTIHGSFKKESYIKGFDLIQNLLDIFPWDIELWQWKGETLKGLGQKEQAEVCFHHSSYLTKRSELKKKKE